MNKATHLMVSLKRPMREAMGTVLAMTKTVFQDTYCVPCTFMGGN